MFRFKRGLPVDYDQQGFIYFTSRRYRLLSPGERKKIRELCCKASREHREALLEYVTTDTPADTVCTRHFLSRSTLERITRRYYMLFAQSL